MLGYGKFKYTLATTFPVYKVPNNNSVIFMTGDDWIAIIVISVNLVYIVNIVHVSHFKCS